MTFHRVNPFNNNNLYAVFSLICNKNFGEQNFCSQKLLVRGKVMVQFGCTMEFSNKGKAYQENSILIGCTMEFSGIKEKHIKKIPLICFSFISGI